MSGIRDLLPFIPPVLVSGLAITNPTTALAECRIAGSTDATYGTDGWVPRSDGKPFGVLWTGRAAEKVVETDRTRTTQIVYCFLAIVHADEPGVILNRNDQANAWIDAMRALVPQNRRLYPPSGTNWPANGDVIWWLVDEEIKGEPSLKDAQDLWGVPFYGVLFTTKIAFTTLVTWQQ